MNYMEELYHKAYLSDSPKGAQDVLLLPKGISPDCTTAMYVNRDLFIETFRNQRGKDGLNEAILSTILSAPEKNNFSVFTILAQEESLLEIYKEKLLELKSANPESYTNNQLLDRGMFESLQESEEPNEGDEENLIPEREQTYAGNYTGDFSANFVGDEEKRNSAIALLEDEKKKILDELESSLEKFCSLLSYPAKIEKITEMAEESKEPEEYQPTEEDIQLAKSYSEEISKMNENIDGLVRRDVFHLLYSLNDVSQEVKDSFLKGVIELMPLLPEERQIYVLNTLTASFMGRQTNNAQLKEVVTELANAGVQNYKFSAIDSLYAILLEFFYSEDGVEK